MPPLTVFYNTLCPVCDAGIGRQRAKLVRLARAGTVVFRDIDAEPGALAAHGVTTGEVRRRLHALDGSGRLLVGAEVALAIWRLTPGEAWLARLLGAPGVRRLTTLAYDRFADVLWAWNRRQGRW